jgi:uncharacterized protein (TIGR02594 family)
MANNPIKNFDPNGADWVEGKDGGVRWKENVNASNYKNVGVLEDGEIYRGTSYERERIWTNVIVKGDVENGLMRESYTTNKQLVYENLTPWVDRAFEEMAKGIAENGNNPEILKYWDYTQFTENAALGESKEAREARAVRKSDQFAWCAAFVNYTLEESGITGTRHALAFSFNGFGQNLGSDVPVYGSIAIMKYHHVGIVVGMNNDGRIILLGGNQGDAINMSPNIRSQVHRYVYPTNYRMPNTQLPLYQLIGRSLDNSNTR